MNSKTVYIKAQNVRGNIDRSYFVAISSPIANVVYGKHDVMRGYYSENYTITQLSTILNLPMDTRFEVRILGNTIRMSYYNIVGFIADHYRILYENSFFKEDDSYDNF